jgi:lipopolysaccharide/colanic/teichoic acid biosynthesis glycosyltransferase
MLELFPAPIRGVSAAMKRGEDLVLGSIILLLSAPLLAAAALAIRAGGPGPILFRQERRGFGGGSFVMFKLRTMQPVAGNSPAQRGDRRVTPVGRVLRRCSIDELPQLWNVLRGEMSLVGPRPHALVHDDAFAALIDGYALRRRMKPGMTGWAQVNGQRGELRDRLGPGTAPGTRPRTRRALEPGVRHVDPAADRDPPAVRSQRLLSRRLYVLGCGGGLFEAREAGFSRSSYRFGYADQNSQNSAHSAE